MKTYRSHLYEKTLIIKDRETVFNKVQIKTSSEAAQYIKQFYFDDLEIYESFFILLLNSMNNTIGFAKIGQGGVTGTYVDPKIIAKYCIDTLSTSVILAHNHPSGNTKPSPADLDTTNRIKNTLQLFDCKVLDHIIITKDSFYSFADNGDLY